MLQKEQRVHNTCKILTKLIWFYRNGGQLNEFKEKLDKFKKSYSNSNDPTLAFCYGLYYYFIRNYNLAIEEFMVAKYDNYYTSLVNLILIDIYIHEDSYLIYSNFFHKEKFKKFEEKLVDVVD